MRDEEGVVLGSGELWTSQIHRLRDVTLHVHGEKKALGRAFHFPTEGKQPTLIHNSSKALPSDPRK